MKNLKQKQLDAEHAAASNVNQLRLTLNAQGMVIESNFPALLNHCGNDPAGYPIAELLPELATIKLMCNGHINPRLRFLCHLGHRFHLTDGVNNSFVHLFIDEIDIQGQAHLRAMILPIEAEHYPDAGIVEMQ